MHQSHIETSGAVAERCDPRHEATTVPATGVAPDPVGVDDARVRRGSRPPTTVRSPRESAESGEGSPEDPGTRLGAAVPRALHEVQDRLHLPEGREEGPAQAGPPVLLPDGGGEGQPG